MRSVFSLLPTLTLLTAGALAAASLASASPADEPPRLSAEDVARFLHQAQETPAKPSMSAAPLAGDDSCQWANDLECDEPEIGTGACAAGTDISDCRYIRDGETDDCKWANDNECDEPRIGTGVCVQGSDRSDCGAVAGLRFRDDSCATAFNGVCEEEGTRLRNGPAQCRPFTDRADCVGRERPLTIYDHFQGYDDRIVLDTTMFPWTAVGRLVFDTDAECTGSLVAPDIVLTAAHCVHDDDGRVRPAGVFRSGFGLPGGAREARISAYYIAPRFNPEVFSSSIKIDATDWAYLRLNRPLGDELGVLPMQSLLTTNRVVLDHAGYSWDTAGHLSGHLGCAAVAINADGTIEHVCDTTQGDSGSPIMLANDEHTIVAVDSNFREDDDGPVVNIAVGAANFIDALDDFAAGRVGIALRLPEGDAADKPAPEPVDESATAEGEKPVEAQAPPSDDPSRADKGEDEAQTGGGLVWVLLGLAPLALFLAAAFVALRRRGAPPA